MNNRWRRVFGIAFLACCTAMGCARQNTELEAPVTDSQQPVADDSSSHRIAGDSNIDVATIASDSTTIATSEANEWQSQLAAAQAGESTAIRISKQSVGLSELADLSRVPELSELTELMLDAGVVDDTQVELIAQLPKLEHLRLRESPLSDVGLATLSNGALRSLRILNIPQAEIGPEGVGCLSAFPNLTQLRLGGARIDDRAVAILATLPELRSLHLIGPRLTEQALEELAKAPKLTSLYVDDCPLADAAWGKLFAAKPGLHVHIDQAHHDRDPSSHKH